jgi:hypothetical protein
MADRARRYEAGLRERQGITAMAGRLDPTVASGPFAGLRYPPDRLAEVDAPVAKLTGVYEQEIAAVFEQPHERFVDVGCAEGYYVVGMARRGVPSIGFDAAKSARALCRAVADANGVDVSVETWFRAEDASLVGDGLLLVDIEGAEADLFTSDVLAALGRAHVVIEVHEDFRPGTGERLRELLAATHDVRRIDQQPRSAPPGLAQWSAEDVEMALTEHRPPAMFWLDCLPS